MAAANDRNRIERYAKVNTGIQPTTLMASAGGEKNGGHLLDTDGSCFVCGKQADRSALVAVDAPVAIRDETAASTGSQGNVCTNDVCIASSTTLRSIVEKKKKRKRGRPPGSKNKGPPKKKKCKVKPFVDLTGIPLQPLILKNDLSHTNYKDNSRHRPVKEGISSKYTGVYFEKGTGKWKAQIMIDRKVRSIGYYESEEEAAGDYARAAFKYKVAKGGSSCYGGLDLSNIPEQPLIRSEKSTTSGYKGVKKLRGRWQARIIVKHGSNPTTLGTFDDVEEAARIYARAAFYLEQNERRATSDSSSSQSNTQGNATSTGESLPLGISEAATATDNNCSGIDNSMRGWVEV